MINVFLLGLAVVLMATLFEIRALRILNKNLIAFCECEKKRNQRLIAENVAIEKKANDLMRGYGYEHY